MQRQLPEESGVIANHISGCLLSGSLADNMRDITLYITTLGSHKHNKSRPKSIKHDEQMEPGGREKRSGECKDGPLWEPLRWVGNIVGQ